MQVIHFNRKPRLNANYSIEGFYNNIREELKNKISIKYVECPFESNGIFRRFYNMVYAAFKQEDVNHVTGDVNYLNFFFKKEKNILTILDCGLLEVKKGFLNKLYKYFWFTLPIQRAKYVVAISEATKKEIINYTNCDSNNIKVIYVAISPLFKRVDKPFNKSKPTILHVGTSPNKNLKRLIQAINGINCKLDIVGKLKAEEIRMLKQYKIDYTSSMDLNTEEVVQKYVNCDILAFVSTYEGFGMPIIEANTVGRAVITSNLLSMPEVAGEAACIVDSYNIDEIRKGILKIIDEDKYRDDLISSGYENAKRFSLEKIAVEHLQLYKLIYDN
jgi:glycosyltransferase involved in cell wall biosynthesis